MPILDLPTATGARSRFTLAWTYALGSWNVGRLLMGFVFERYGNPRGRSRSVSEEIAQEMLRELDTGAGDFRRKRA